mgnify:CR=1 FL=1
MKRHRTKKNTYWRPKGQFCNPDDVFRHNMWREIGGPSKTNRRKHSVFCDFTNKVPHAVWAGFSGKSDSEHPKTQQRDRKIGQTIGSPMRISAVQLVLFTKGMEARIRKKQEERSRLWEPLGSLGEPLGNPLGRLGEGFGETQRAFFDETCLIFIIID